MSALHLIKFQEHKQVITTEFRGTLLSYQLRHSYCTEEDEVDKSTEVTDKRQSYTPVDVETSIKYLESDAYAETYGDQPVWFHFRPNHPTGRPRERTRRTCVRGGHYSTGQPCPICRDDHLVMDYRNVKLLKQFLTPNEVTIHVPFKTQICQMQHKKLLIALEKAKESGMLEDKNLEFRSYDYSQYYKSCKTKTLAPPDTNHQDSFATKVLRKESAT
ncbi:small ribosomal subunit protein mS40-like [Watersipora subatra]|uniref:small ribosomal subunit protein mS40-like n=1 Tax=Watersipora subatra TaxID=2589382 RepID=UPI00355C203D